MNYIDPILSRLSSNLTVEEQKSLSKDSVTRFMGGILSIFEAKALKYLEYCGSSVKKKVQAEGVSSEILDATTTERVGHCAYAVLFHQNKLSCLPALIYLLKSSNPQLLAVTGLKAVYTTEGKPECVAEMFRKVFISYMARHRLFEALSTDDLRAVCKEMSQENPQAASLLFPPYLLEAFAIQKGVGQILANCPESVSTAISATKNEHKEVIFSSVRAILFYVGTVLKNGLIEEKQRDRLFKHLNSDEALNKFATTLAQAWVSITERDYSEMLMNHEALYTSAVAKECFVPMRFLGFQFSMADEDFSQLRNELAAKTKEIEEQARQKREQIAAARSQAIAQAHGQINEALKNFKPAWQVQVGASIQF